MKEGHVASTILHPSLDNYSRILSNVFVLTRWGLKSSLLDLMIPVTELRISSVEDKRYTHQCIKPPSSMLSFVGTIGEIIHRYLGEVILQNDNFPLSVITGNNRFVLSTLWKLQGRVALTGYK